MTTTINEQPHGRRRALETTTDTRGSRQRQYRMIKFGSFKMSSAQSLLMPPFSLLLLFLVVSSSSSSSSFSQSAATAEVVMSSDSASHGRRQLQQQQQQQQQDSASAAANRQPLLWSSTGGGWRAMFADVGFANAFQKAGLFTPEGSSLFTSVATTSGGTWFSTQLFYSQPFYDRTVLASRPDDIYDFVVEWMATYAAISNTTDEDILANCDTSDLEDSRVDVSEDVIESFQDMCYLLVKYDFDWTKFIHAMLHAASSGYGDPTFVDRRVVPSTRIPAMNDTDLLIQSTLVPNSRIRNESSIDGNGVAVYLGYDNSNNDNSSSNSNNDTAESSSSSSMPSSNIFSVVLSAAWVVQSTSADFVYGYTDLTDNIQAYFTTTQADHSWEDWDDFYLYPGNGGTVSLQSTQIGATGGDSSGSGGSGSPLRTPFGGGANVTITQIASISSAAAGSGSPRAPSVYTQMFSIPYYYINQYTVRTVWRVLAGIAVAASAGLLFFFVCVYFGHYKCNIVKEEQRAHMVGIVTGTCCGILLGLITAFVWGIGSIVIPNGYNTGVNRIYMNESFDNFAVCTQWPNPCGEQDGFFIDGWFVDNPAFVINIGHHQQKQIKNQPMATNGINITTTDPLKAIITNTNEEWDTEWNRAQILQYFSTYFNVDVSPGGFLWGPGFYAPYRSPQVFREYLDPDGLDALLVPIEGTNLTTALLRGTTVDNPSFGVVSGQSVEILLINTNAPITTFVVGQSQIEALSGPLAEMAAEIAGSDELVRRVQDFVRLRNDQS